MKMFPLLLLLLATSAAAQDKLSPESSASNTHVCTDKLVEDAEEAFRLRRWRSQMLGRAEQQLKAVVQLCKETPAAYQAQEQLKVVQEDLANNSLTIALFYLDKFRNGKGGKAGAFARLKSISEKYPRYSKLDQVLALLGQLNLDDGNLDEARACYQKIIQDFPGSQYAGEASKQLSAIEVLKADRSLKPNP